MLSHLGFTMYFDKWVIQQEEVIKVVEIFHLIIHCLSYDEGSVYQSCVDSSLLIASTLIKYQWTLIRVDCREEEEKGKWIKIKEDKTYNNIFQRLKIQIFNPEDSKAWQI